MTGPAKEARPTLAELLLAGRDPAQLVPLAEVAAALPGRRPGKRMNARALERHCRQGLRGRVLSSYMFGGRRMLRWGDVAEFYAALERRSEPTPRPSPRTEAARRQRAVRLHRAAAALLR